MQCRYYIPTLNLIGRGCVQEIGREARNLHGKRAFIVASTGPIGEGQADFVAAILEKEGLECVRFCKAVPNPTVAVVDIGVDAYQRAQCDIIIAVGGGSAIDSAKAIGILVTNGGRIQDYDGVNRSDLAMPPLIAISTTAGTGSEITQFAVINDEANHSKFTIVDWHMTPNVSVNDPEMMLSMPPALTAATGMDAMTHAIEAYVSKQSTPVTDAKAWQGIALAAKYLPIAVHDGQNMEARENMCYASFLAGAAFNTAGLGLVHAMAHPLGGFYNLPHGVCNALLLPHVALFNMDSSLEKFSSIAIALGVGQSWRSPRDNAELAVKALFAFQKQLDLPSGLGALGVKADDIPHLAGLALEEEIGRTNPRCYSREQVEQIYRNAL